MCRGNQNIDVENALIGSMKVSPYVFNVLAFMYRGQMVR